MLEAFLASVLCVAEVGYFEARGEPNIGQVAVMQTVVQRTRDARYPADACAVAHQARLGSTGLPLRNRCAYSYYCDGKSEVIRDQRAWNQALINSVFVSLGWLPAVAPGALHFYSGARQPWPADHAVVIGRHSFLIGVR
jgi:spore germination cell wall hydrolase CwlJ-like protein